MMSTSLISFAKFSLSCAKFVQREKTNRILKSLENDLVLLRDRKIKTAISLMDDAKFSSNSKNQNYFIDKSLPLFIEAIHSYDSDDAFYKTLKNGAIDFLIEEIEDKCKDIFGISYILQKWGKKNKEIIDNADWILDCYETACLGAGICYYYLREYAISFNYFDKALLYNVKIISLANNLISAVLTNELLLSRKTVYKIIGQIIINSKLFDNIYTLESHGVVRSSDPNTNLYKLKTFYDVYKTARDKYGDYYYLHIYDLWYK